MQRSTLSLALSGLDAEPFSSLPVREQIELAARRQFRAVHLDAARAGVRPRDLDRSARRDLASLLRRSDLVLGGLDLWIPPAHFADPARADRAAEAAILALGLAGELAGLVPGSQPTVGVTLPRGAGAPGAILDALRGAAERAGSLLADFSLPPTEAEAEFPGFGLDPAAALAIGEDPARLASRRGPALVAARLSDQGGVGRVTPGDGRLDLLAYRVAIETAGRCPVVALDLRGVRDHERALEAAREAWPDQV